MSLKVYVMIFNIQQTFYRIILRYLSAIGKYL